MAKVLSDHENSALNDVIDKFKFETQHGNIDCRSAIDALNRMIHRKILSRDPVQMLVKSGIFKDFTDDQGLVAANLLDLEGFVVNLSKDDSLKAALRFTQIGDKEGRARHCGIYMDFDAFRNQTLEHGLDVSWYYSYGEPTNLSVDSFPDKDQEWPDEIFSRLKLLTPIISNTFKYAFLRRDDKVFGL